jgi:site-specific DNA recombinase
MPMAKKQTAEIVKGVIYARYSSSGQRDESIEGQLRDCRAFAEKYGIAIVAEYCDRALTGTTDKRPEFQRMIRDSAKGQFTVIITWKNDRFARSRYDSAIYKYKLKQYGIRILYAKESIPDGPEGIILESVMEGFAEYYSANLSQNVKRGNYDSALKRQTLGQVVYGLRKGADSRFELDPATAPVVRRIFEEYAAGRPALDIYADLNAEGFRTSRGNLFNKNSLRRILQNEKYVGVYEFGDIRDEDCIPPIVDRALFDKVQKVVERHHRAPAAKKTDGGFLLTAKLFCGECGSPMTGDGGTGRSGTVYSYYICNGRRAKKCQKERAQKQWIEDTVVAELAKIVNDDAMIEEFADRFMDWQAKQKGGGALSGLEQRLKQNQTAIKNTMSVIDSGLITDSLKSHLMELEAERVSLEAGIAKEKLETPELERDAVVWFLERFRDGDQSDVGWRIFIVETFLQAVYLYDDGRLLMHLNFGGKKNTVSLKLVEKAVSDGEALGSSFAPSGAPNGANLNRSTVYFYDGLLVALIFVQRKRAEG